MIRCVLVNSFGYILPPDVLPRFASWSSLSLVCGCALAESLLWNTWPRRSKPSRRGISVLLVPRNLALGLGPSSELAHTVKRPVFAYIFQSKPGQYRAVLHYFARTQANPSPSWAPDDGQVGPWASYQRKSLHGLWGSSQLECSNIEGVFSNCAITDKRAPGDNLRHSSFTSAKMELCAETTAHHRIQRRHFRQ